MICDSQEQKDKLLEIVGSIPGNTTLGDVMKGTVKVDAGPEALYRAVENAEIAKEPEDD